jgi:hypothetical protein
MWIFGILFVLVYLYEPARHHRGEHADANLRWMHLWCYECNKLWKAQKRASH